ncbi:ABC-type transport auxiliary lipoprotein family protein, partial [Photobacterium makurazakiensis]|uniref:PqiC family protein n=1 Tax=Photobacterium makurazakiensis TaxID=2910234 RepID=UPI003D0DB29A
GCSSSEPAVKTYLIPNYDTDQFMTYANKSQPLVIVRPVEVSAHLNSTGLVYQVSDTEIVQAQQNLWAENLTVQLTRLITSDLRRKQSRYWFDELTPAIGSVGLPKLQVKFTAFNGHFSGLAKLKGQWIVINQAGDVISRQPFFIQVPLEEAGYNAQVKALSVGVDRLTEQISQNIGQISL